MKRKALIFEFTSYTYQPAEGRVFLNYRTEFSNGEALEFTETIILQKPATQNLPKGLLDKLLEGVHIALGISYYKLYPIKYREAVISPRAKLFNRVNCAIDIKIPYKLSKKEAEFWNTVYKKGLGEFFFKNNLDPKISPRFPYKKNYHPKPISCILNPKSLLGIGGGKDSIVTAELLKEHRFDFETLFIETNKESALVKNITELIGKPSIKIIRLLDKKIFEEHRYKGHIPISAIYAFIGTFTAAIYGFSSFIVSNEHSSNFGNTTYRGQTINHQWSKSLEFETLFRNYLKGFVSGIEYLSLLRPFYEIRIVKLFSKYSKYFSHFSSCNSNFKIRKTPTSLWCCNCAKCIFVFTLLSAFLKKKDLIKIFGKNVYEEQNLLPLFKDILGLGKMKPFDCVGTFEEAQSAMHLAVKEFKGSFIVEELSKKIAFYSAVLKIQKESYVPEKFKFLGMESALILGFGREGKVTNDYLKKYYPKLRIGIADEQRSKDYLKAQENFDIAIKTPGIKKGLITIPYTTATNMFFSNIKGKNTIIGITGSKGKSTTASLIFAILEAAGKKTRLLGNIGDPMLGALLKPIKDEIFVLELSSYQLDDIKFSPDISVVTSLFPEHMDFHGGEEHYYRAKKNVINYQDENNFFVYDPNNKIAKIWLKNYPGKAIPFVPTRELSRILGGKATGTKSIPLKESEIPLVGPHNKNNIRAAVSVARVLGIKDAAIKRAIKKFKPLPHRLELVGTFKDITFYDDANAATPEATIMALQSIKNIDTIFLGGQDRGYKFLNLEKALKKHKIRNIVLFPDSGTKMIKNKKAFHILHTSSMKEAVVFAYKNTTKGNVCLLSCASPSYSLWENFEEKGDQFKKFVKQLSHDEKSG